MSKDLEPLARAIISLIECSILDEKDAVDVLLITAGVALQALSKINSSVTNGEHTFTLTVTEN